MNRLLVLLLTLCLFTSSARGAEEIITVIGGETIKVLYFEPEDVTRSTPLAMLLAGGSNNEFMARTQFWMGKEMVSRGWAIAIPVSPAGRNYFRENASLFPQLISDIRRIYRLDAAKTLLVGISSGGSAALAIAAHNAEDYLGVVAVPGRVPEDLADGALRGLPVYLRVGEKDDFRWNRGLDEVIARLEAAGAQVDAKLVPDARHVFPLDWEELEGWLSAAQARN